MHSLLTVYKVMRIEEEIQSTKFEDNYHKAVVNLTYTYGWLNNILRAEFERNNLTHQQFNVLHTQGAIP